ncbi:hypothetical protein KM043_014902 [Ampulex compressa]|nr:hypothetical protein KM043_014902 [Ampulex compressa]
MLLLPRGKGIAKRRIAQEAGSRNRSSQLLRPGPPLSRAAVRGAWLMARSSQPRRVVSQATSSGLAFCLRLFELTNGRVPRKFEARMDRERIGEILLAWLITRGGGSCGRDGCTLPSSNWKLAFLSDCAGLFTCLSPGMRDGEAAIRKERIKRVSSSAPR